MTKLKLLKSKMLVASLLVVLILNGIIFSPLESNAKTKIYNLRLFPQKTSIAMNWYTDRPYYAELYYGESNDYGHVIYFDRFTDWNTFEIKGLKPDTTYYYKIVVKNKNGETVAEYENTFTTLGEKPKSQIFKQYFYLNFNNNFYSQNNQYPKEIFNPKLLKIVEPSIWSGALQVKNKNSHLIYSADKIFNPGYGTVNVWVRIENFNDDMVIWQTDDSRYALYFDKTGRRYRIVARAGLNEKSDIPEEASYFFSYTGKGKNVWKPGEWHFLSMTWEGKLNGIVKLYIDGEMRAKANYTNGGGCKSFMIGNNYRHDMPFKNGQIDEFKMYNWNMNSTSVRNEYKWSNINQEKDLIKKTGQVAGYKVRYFKDGKILKAKNDPRVYVLSHNKKIHISDLSAWSRYKNRKIIIVTPDELDQYPDGGTFYSWSKYPDGTLLKGSNSTVYWLWNNQKHPIANETVFNKYGNSWQDIVVVSDQELNNYSTGFIYK